MLFEEKIQGTQQKTTCKQSTKTTDVSNQIVYKRMILRGVWWVSLVTIFTVGAVLFLYYSKMEQGYFLICWLSSCWLLSSSMITIELLIKRAWRDEKLTQQSLNCDM